MTIISAISTTAQCIYGMSFHQAFSNQGGAAQVAACSRATASGITHLLPLLPFLFGFDGKLAAPLVGMALAAGGGAWAARAFWQSRQTQVLEVAPPPAKDTDSLVAALQKAKTRKCLNQTKAGRLVAEAVYKATLDPKAYSILLFAINEARGLFNPANQHVLLGGGGRKTLDLERVGVDFLDGVFMLAFVLAGVVRTLKDESSSNRLIDALFDEGNILGTALMTRVRALQEPLTKLWVGRMSSDDATEKEAFGAMRLYHHIFDPLWYQHVSVIPDGLQRLRPDISIMARSYLL